MRGRCGDFGSMCFPFFCRMASTLRWAGMQLGTAAMVAALGAAAPPAAKRILFLGDSITYRGTYVEFIEAALIAQYSDAKYEVINLGLGSETVSGLSEEGHAGGRFPRPNLHDRLDRALAEMKPDPLIACYGMKDGIYLPLAEYRLAAYHHRMVRLRAQVIASGAGLNHSPPPAFAPVPTPDGL